MKKTIVNKLLAFADDCSATLKLWYADERIFKNKVVELEDDAWFDEIKERNHTYHISFEGKYSNDEDFTAESANFDVVYEMFKEKAKNYGFACVCICEDFEKYNPYKEIIEVRTQEEEYYDACMASNYGDESLMRQYNRKYEIEEEYGPSNPWDAPGMSVSDFISGVY